MDRAARGLSPPRGPSLWPAPRSHPSPAAAQGGVSIAACPFSVARYDRTGAYRPRRSCVTIAVRTARRCSNRCNITRSADPANSYSNNLQRQKDIRSGEAARLSAHVDRFPAGETTVGQRRLSGKVWRTGSQSAGRSSAAHPRCATARSAIVVFAFQISRRVICIRDSASPQILLLLAHGVRRSCVRCDRVSVAFTEGDPAKQRCNPSFPPQLALLGNRLSAGAVRHARYGWNSGER
jgi:hypothetical protein